MPRRGKDHSLAVSAGAKALVALAAAAISIWAVFQLHENRLRSRVPTFTRDVAPIVLENCAACHRPGGVAPFSLLDFAAAKKRAKEIVEVTTSRFMPPWLPDPGSHFRGERRLNEAQIRTLRRWVEAGTPEGNPVHLPPIPPRREGWQLGEPDLVVTLPDEYPLPAEGRDVYRNFVAAIPNEISRFVRAVELKPSNPRVVHHAFLLVDATGESRRLDAKDDAPGFPGMNPGAGAINPGGHFLSWQPGTTPAIEPAGTQWELQPGSDAVFQLHMRPSGKPESVRMSAGFYFTDEAPTRFPFRMLLRSTAIDIPPGEENYVIESSYRLPVDIAVLAVLPHAHYLGRDLQGWAELPDGSRKTILSIRHWDFNWQDHYQFAEPLLLPKGATLRMRYTYDNSARNPVNSPETLRRVQFGEQTSDEMGELWLQVVTNIPSQRAVLEADYVRNWAAPDTIALARLVLSRNPNDSNTRANLGAVLAVMGRLDEATLELHRAADLDPRCAKAHANLGNIYMQRKDLPRARDEFEQALALDPSDYKARNNLGYVLLVSGNASRAAEEFERVLRSRPGEALARKNLERARAMMDRGNP